MRLLINTISWAILGTLLGFLIISLCIPDIRTQPHYKGVDKRVEGLVNEYKILASNNGIYFSHVVTIGFTDIKDKNTLGVTHFGNSFREIDIDTAYWNRTSDISKKTLIFHELTHAYCGRNHDYGDMKSYSDIYLRIATIFHPKAGFMFDDCPLSLMYPFILKGYCVRDHYVHYIKEMFERCNPF